MTDTVNLGFYRPVWPQTLWGRIRINLIPIYPEIEDTPATWVPGAVGVNSSGGGSEHATYHVRLVANLPVTGKVRVTIEDVTRYPGYAMNAEYGDGRDSPDLQVVCDAQHNTGWNCSYDSNDNKWVIDSKQELNSQTPGPGLELVVDSYDFAAYGKLNVELLSLSSPIVEPQPLDPGTLGRGRVKDRPGEEDHTTLPIDRGEGQGTAGNKIADAGWEAEVQMGQLDDTPDMFLPEEDLDITPPTDFDAGDGFVGLEEYRGYRANERHIRTHPLVKDLFIGSEFSVEGIGYSINIPMAVHHVNSEQDYCGLLPTIERVMNCNSEGIPIRMQQCGIHVTRDNVFPSPEVTCPPKTGPSKTRDFSARMPGRRPGNEAE